MPTIQAVNGHTIYTKDEEVLTQLFPGCQWPTACAHGTFHTCVSSILKYGLVAGGLQRAKGRRARRPHIHFVPTIDIVKGQIPGLRTGATVLVRVDFQTAMQDGIEFYYSFNQVILTRGDERGMLPLRYIVDITDISDLNEGKRRVIWRRGIDASEARISGTASTDA